MCYMFSCSLYKCSKQQKVTKKFYTVRQILTDYILYYIYWKEASWWVIKNYWSRSQGGITQLPKRLTVKCEQLYKRQAMILNWLCSSHLLLQKQKRLYIVISIICSLYYSYKISIIILFGVILMTIVEATKLRIEELCNERGLNFCRLATIFGVPYTTVKSNVYNQSKNPSITTIKKICDGLDITITDFFDTETFRNLEQEIKWFKPTFLSRLFLFYNIVFCTWQIGGMVYSY